MRRECDELARELALAEPKLSDFKARLGAVFPHERYLAELSALRDELRVALSAMQESTGPKVRTPAELSESIKTLRESHTVEALPVRGTTGGNGQGGAARCGTDSRARRSFHRPPGRTAG